ncbi:MAG TPA: thioredoxin family protein, partial [Burkholderiales bacterium]|nr:thioredoxin family protein [Burkholderiales bacterium]
MKVQLLVSEWCVPCRAAEQVWLELAKEKAIAFEVLDVGQPEGRSVVARLGVRTVPASIVDGALAHLGVPSMKEARELAAAAPDRDRDSDQHYVGLSMAPTSAWAVASAVVYLALAGAALVLGGGIVGEPPWRGAALHAFGLGFAAFLAMGLGEHMLPRFIGAPIRGGAIAWLQLAAAHAGTLLLVAGLGLGLQGVALAGGAAAWAAFALFAAR